MTETLHVLGKSMPRSGTGLLARLLTRYFNGDLYWCEFYTPPSCCKSTPCATPRARYSMQKSHDFGFKDRSDLPAVYIIQHRSILPRLLSNFDHNVSIGAAKDSYDALREQLKWGAEYQSHFMRKWVASPPPSGVVIDYDGLTTRPQEELGRAVQAIAEYVDEGKIHSAVSAEMNFDSSHGSVREKFSGRRDIRAHRYYGQRLLDDLEFEVERASSQTEISPTS